MLLLMQGRIFLKGPIPLFPSITALVKLLLRAIHHVVYVAGTHVMIVNEHESQSPITVLLIWIEVRPCVQYLEDWNHFVPNQCYVGNERVGKWTDFFRFSSKWRRPTKNWYSGNNLLIVRKVLASIIAVRGITCGNRRYKIIPKPIAEGLSIYSTGSSYLLFHRLQGLGPVPWTNGDPTSGSLWDSSMWVIRAPDENLISLFTC